MLVALSLVLATLCLLPSFGKLTGHPRMRASAAHFNIAWERYQLIGVAELAAAAGVLAGLVWPAVGVAAALCLAVLLFGAVVSHLRAGDTVRELAPALLLLVVDAAYLAVAMPVRI